jgi:hypothetical protein
MSKSTAASVKSPTNELSVQQHESDSPLLPVAQLERLHTFRPDLVDWVVAQTQAEAEYRRRSIDRVNGCIFRERVYGQTLAFLLGLSGVAGGGYIALNGQPWAGFAKATAVITGLAVTFLTGKETKGQKVAKGGKS